MTEFYAPSPRAVTLPESKRRFALRRGIQEIPDELANHLDANDYGIVPVDEMSDAQWAALALSKDAYMAARAAKMAAEAPVEAAEGDPAPAGDAGDVGSSTSSSATDSEPHAHPTVTTVKTAPK